MLVLLAGAFGAACHENGTEPARTLAPTYTLAAVDGVPIPAPVESSAPGTQPLVLAGGSLEAPVAGRAVRALTYTRGDPQSPGFEIAAEEAQLEVTWVDRERVVLVLPGVVSDTGVIASDGRLTVRAHLLMVVGEKRELTFIPVSGGP